MLKPKWDEMSVRDRQEALHRVYPDRGAALLILESKMKWNKLLPSTQDALKRILP